MRKYLALLSLISSAAFGQDYLDSIAVETCKCIKEIQATNDQKQDLNIRLGSCLIKVAFPYKKQLMADNAINMDELNEETGKRLGMLISSRMLSTCPETLAAISGKTKKNPVNQKTGRIQEVVANEFVTLTVIDDSRMISKFIWLKNFPGSNELATLKKPKGHKVTIDYEVVEYYDPRIKDYRNFNVISALKLEEQQ